MSEQPKLRVRVENERGIYRRKSKDGKTTRYEVAVWAEGRQSWRTVPSLREAKQLRADLISKAGRGERIAPPKVVFGVYATEWLDKQTRLRPSTREAYGNRIRLQLMPTFETRTLASITVDDVAALAGELEGAGLSLYTVRSILGVLGRIFASAVRVGLVNGNPVRALTKEERPHPERREFPDLDTAAITKLIGATTKRYRTLVAVSVFTGVRQGEGLGLVWENVDLKKGVLHVAKQLDRSGSRVEPKTRAAKRDVPLAPFLVKLLKAHKEEAFARGLAKPDDLVFCSEAGAPLMHRTVGWQLAKSVEAAKLPALRWHDLRHVAASMMIAGGDPVSYIARVLGHSSPAVTMTTYAHVFASAEHADGMRERQEAAFGGVLG